MIVAGHLQGNGTDKTAERNGLILAANRLSEDIIGDFSLDESSYRQRKVTQ